MPNIGIGIIGYGYAARNIHLPLLSKCPDYKIVAVLERSDKKASDELGIVLNSYSDPGELVRDPAVDLVLVCSPNDLHFSHAMLALEAHKHALVDKPMAFSADQCTTLISKARQVQRVLSVYHNRLFDADFLHVQNILASASLGRIHSAELRMQRYVRQTRPKPWKESGQEGNETIDDLGSHLIASALNLWGKPQSLYCSQARQRSDTKIHDAFWLDFFYPDDFHVQISSSLLVKESLPRWSLYGEEASAHLWDWDPQEDQLKQGLRPGDEAFGLIAQGKSGPDYPRGCWVNFYHELQRTLSNSAAGGPDRFALTGIEVVKLIELARLSAAQGRRMEV